MEEEKTKKKLLPQFSYFLRVLVGGYLIYLAYGLLGSIGNYQGGKKALFIAAIVLFTVVGAGVLLHSIYKLCRGEYAGGRADVIENDEADLNFDDEDDEDDEDN